MLRRTLIPSPSPSSALGLTSSSSSPSPPPLLLQSLCHFTREERAPGPKPNSSRVQGNRRHPLERMRHKPASRNISIPDSAHAGGGGGGGNFAVRPAEMQQASLRRGERLDRDEEMLWQGTVLSDTTSSTVAKHIGKLHSNPKYRDSQGRFLLTGQHLMAEAIEMTKKKNKDDKSARRLQPKHLLVRSDRAVPEWAGRFRNTEIVKVKPHVLDALYPGNDGFVGDFEMPAPPLKEELMVNNRKFRSVLVLDNISDPGLLGNMVRSAAAFAYDAVFLVNQCADWYHHDVLRSSRGVHFQSLTPIYVLKEENGDDVGAMLNHLIARNNLTPLILTPNSSTSAAAGSAISGQPGSVSASLSPIARAALERGDSNSKTGGGEAEEGSAAAAAAVESNKLPERLQGHDRRTLHQIMIDSYCGWSDKQEQQDDAAPKEEEEEDNSTNLSFEPRSHMLCVSSDQRGNFEARMQKMLTAKKPTTLLLDDDEQHQQSDLAESFPTALYQLRHSAAWDFLPLSVRDSGSAALGPEAKQSLFGGGSADFDDMAGPQSERSRNLSEDEFAHKVRSRKAMYRETRINRLRDNTDEDVWRKFEQERVLLENESKRPGASPLDDPAHRDERNVRRRRDLDARREESLMPDEIIERQELMNRDVLNELEEWASGYEAPRNYEHRSKTPRWSPEKWPEEERQKAGERRAVRERKQAAWDDKQSQEEKVRTRRYDPQQGGK